MSESHDEQRQYWAGIAIGLTRARSVLAAAALVFAVLAVAGTVSVLQALVGFAVIAVVAIWMGGTNHEARAALVLPLPAPTPGDPLIETVIAGIPDAVVALDRDGRVLALNAAAEAMAPALRRGDPASIALRMPELVEAIRSANATGEPQRIEFSERVPLDRWYEAIVAPVGRPPDLQMRSRQFVLVTFRDLTPLRRVEEMRADFVANASHELRTPLAALSGFIDTLQGPARDDPAAQKRFLPIMHAQATRMARLIDDLLSLSRIELNAHRLPDKRLDVVPLVRQVVDAEEISLSN